MGSLGNCKLTGGIKDLILGLYSSPTGIWMVAAGSDGRNPSFMNKLFRWELSDLKLV